MERRELVLPDALKHVPTYTVAAIRQGGKSTRDGKGLKATPSWTDPFKILAVGPSLFGFTPKRPALRPPNSLT